MPMKYGEVWWAEFPFEEIQGNKIRPVIVLDNGNFNKIEVLSIKISSKFAKDDYDVPILYWQESKLRCPSIARVSKFVLLSKSKFINKIGDIHQDDLDLVKTKFEEYLLNL